MAKAKGAAPVARYTAAQLEERRRLSAQLDRWTKLYETALGSDRLREAKEALVKVDESEAALAALARSARLAQIEDDLDRLEFLGAGAVADGSHTAVATLERQRQELLAQRRIAEAGKDQRDRATMSPEEWAAEVTADAQAATVPDLEIYVREYLARVGYALTVVDGDTLTLARR